MFSLVMSMAKEYGQNPHPNCPFISPPSSSPQQKRSYFSKKKKKKKKKKKGKICCFLCLNHLMTHVKEIV